MPLVSPFSIPNPSYPIPQPPRVATPRDFSLPRTELHPSPGWTSTKTLQAHITGATVNSENKPLHV